MSGPRFLLRAPCFLRPPRPLRSARPGEEALDVVGLRGQRRPLRRGERPERAGHHPAAGDGPEGGAAAPDEHERAEQPVAGNDRAARRQEQLARGPAEQQRVEGTEQALALLARRYLAGHAPADARDLAKWAGLPLRDARRGLAAIAPGLADRDDGLASLAAPEEAPPVPDVRLLGAFDPLLLGWASRELFLAPGGPVITSNGLFRPFVLVRGRGAALWTVTGGQVLTDPLGQLSAPEQAALAAEAADVERFLGRARGTRRAPGARAARDGARPGL